VSDILDSILDSILEWLKDDKGCRPEDVVGWWGWTPSGATSIVTPNGSKFLLYFQEEQINVFKARRLSFLGACLLCQPDMFERLAKILGLPPDPPVPAWSVAPNPDGGN